MSMNVNGITSAQTQAAYAYSTTKSRTITEETAEVKQTAAKEAGVVYEPSNEETTDTVKKTYTPDTNLINKLKADADARTQQLRTLVEQMITRQSTAYGNATDIWSFLREGNYTVDPATKAQAQADIADDGYWGVNQTSDRIIQFANALTGGDPDKIEEMRSAFQKGFKAAEETWGGKLPDISQKTYEAVMEKFDKLAEAAKQTTDTTAEATAE